MEKNKSAISLSVSLPVGSTALVTGAAKRLGKEISLGLARNGCDVVLHCHKSFDQAEKLAAEIEYIGRRAWIISGDLSDENFAASLVEKAAEKIGAPKLNILVNNASIFRADTITDAIAADINKNIAVHSTAALLTTRSLSKLLGDNGCGRVVNMIDARVHDVDGKNLSYHLSKRMLLDITRLSALEFAPQLSVNAIAPGIVLPPEGQGLEYLEKLKNSNPLCSYGSVNQIIDAALFLLSSEFITGQVIYVDGGRHMKGAVHH